MDRISNKMSNDSLICLGVILIIITAGFFLIPIVIKNNETRDKEVVEKGTITKKFIEEVNIGLSHNKLYYFELNNNIEQEVNQDDYDEFDVGDYIKIYASGRIEED